MIRSLYIYIGLLLIILLGGFSAQFIDVETDLEGYSLASTEDRKIHEQLQANFPKKGSGETVSILEKKEGWKTYLDFKRLDGITKHWESFSEVKSATSIATIQYPKRQFGMTRKVPFLNLSSEKAFLKRYSKRENYKDITEKFISKNSKYVLLFLRLKDGKRINEKLTQSIQKSGLLRSDIKIHYLQYDVLQDEVKGLVKSDSFWLAIISTGLILLAFFVLTQSLKGLALIGVMVLFNLACTALFMFGFQIPFTIHTITVPCIVIVLSFTDLMHMMYYQRKLREEVVSDVELRKRIIERIKVPMLVTSLTNIVGFVIFLALSENELLFNFALVSIVGVAIAFLSSRFIAIQLMKRDVIFLKRGESKRLNDMHTFVQFKIERYRKLVLGFTVGLGVLLLIGAVQLFKIDGFSGNMLVNESPQLHASSILKNEFFGSKQLEIIAKIDDGTLLNPRQLKVFDDLEKEIELTFKPNYINGLPTIVKRYNRYAHNGHTGAFKLPEQLPSSAKKELLEYMNELGGNGILSEDQSVSKIVFGYADEGLKSSRERYQKLEKVLQNYQGEIQFTITGRHYIADNGAYNFTWKIMIGLGLGILFSSILTFFFVRSFRESLGLILVNLLPVLLALVMMLIIGIAITPVTLFFLSLLAGICVDDSVYIVTQHKRLGRLQKFPIFVTSVVMAVGFISLGFSSFVWVRPFAWVFLIGLGSAYLLDLFILPLFFKRNTNFGDRG